MSLFDLRSSVEREEFFGADAATRALSVTEVETDFVRAVYQQIARVYDFTFGPTLHAGRLQAIQRMRIDPGSKVLEVGVGTGINAALYPSHCAVTGIDLSARMLEKARVRLARKGVHNVRLMEMDATALTFPSDSFDIVYAPYVISVVPDPVAVAREMHRVCKPGGRIVVLNHFRSRSRVGAFLERAIAPVTPYLGFKSDLDLPAFLAQADFDPISIEKVNVPPIWSLVTCIKD
jgi:phosphatidylethanolamine/phosphatidyl-N-methylethanolamine N-methyltransferase